MLLKNELKPRWFELICITYLLTIPFIVNAQKGWTSTTDSSIYTQTPSLSIVSNIHERVGQEASQRSIKDPYIANNRQVLLTTENSGVWHANKTGENVWRLKLHIDDVYSIALTFKDVLLSASNELKLYNKEGLKYTFTHQNITKSGVLQTPYLQGEEVLIEYSSTNKHQYSVLSVVSISQAYVDIFQMDESSSSNTRINDDCYLCIGGDSLSQIEQSVVLINVFTEEGAKACTGTLLNNTALDGSPLLLTAEHCINSQEEGDNSLYLFNENQICGNSNRIDNEWVHGAELLVTSYEHDFTLLRLYQIPPLAVSPYLAGWNLSPEPFSDLLTIHHPNGGPRRTSITKGFPTSSNFANDSTRAENAFWKIKKWDSGITESGSSGSALFNADFEVIGSLVGGSASCASPYNDYFQKLAIAPGLSAWLDPLNLGVDQLDGMDPFENISASCDTIVNIGVSTSIGLELYQNGTGSYSGVNSDSIDTYAEKFFSSDSALITGAFLLPFDINGDAPGGIMVRLHEADENGLPGTVIQENFAAYETLSTRRGYVELYPYKKVKNDFFISYEIAYTEADNFALSQALWGEQNENTAFVKLADGWAPITQISPEGQSTSLRVEVHICTPTSDTPVPAPETNRIDFYPNPTTDVVVGKLNFLIPDDVSIHIYDLQGRRYQVSHQKIGNNVLIDLSSLGSQMYFVNVLIGQKTFMTKVIKR